MKNIYVLPTDKPSRLRIGDNGNFVFGMIQTSIQSRNNDFTNQNIYIISNEDTKEGWHFNIAIGVNKPVFVKNEDIENLKNVYKDGLNHLKKIILTTDQDLIKDGIQPIDDDFLEWFVKNPSCESVEVNFIEDNWGYYEIIIPQEEPKLQTLEEAAESNYNNKTAQIPVPTSHWIDSKRLQIQNFIEGANWQAKRMYSEEEVENILIEYIKTNPTKPYRVISWFQQFKKK